MRILIRIWLFHVVDGGLIYQTLAAGGLKGVHPV